MRIIASDFDGTITHKGITPEFRTAVAEWRADGNLFGIVTGRPVSSIRQALFAAKLAADFIISDNGALAFDRDGNCLHALIIPPEDVYEGHRILREFHCDIFRLSNRYAYMMGDCVPEFYLDREKKAVCSDSFSMRDIVEYFARFDTPEACETAKAAVSERLGGRVRGTSSGLVTADFVRSDAYKSTGLAAFIREAGLSPEKVYTLGDAPNDLDMLVYPAFEGYAVENAMESVKEAVGRCVESPLELIRKVR